MSARPDADRRLDDSELVEALDTSRRLGMLGSAAISDVIAHSAAFLPPLDDVSGTVVDLGSGGGVPGLVIAWMRPDLRIVMVDRRATRADHLHRLVHRLELAARVQVVNMEAAALTRLIDRAADAVVARSFGSPAEVMKAAVPLLAPGGLLVVAEPPAGGTDRWSGVAPADVERVPSIDPRVAVHRRR